MKKDKASKPVYKGKELKAFVHALRTTPLPHNSDQVDDYIEMLRKAVKESPDFKDVYFDNTEGDSNDKKDD